MTFKIKDQIGKFEEITKNLYFEVNRENNTIFIQESDEPDGSIPCFIPQRTWNFQIPRLKRKHRKLLAEQLAQMLDEGVDSVEIRYLVDEKAREYTYSYIK